MLDHLTALSKFTPTPVWSSHGLALSSHSQVQYLLSRLYISVATESVEGVLYSTEYRSKILNYARNKCLDKKVHLGHWLLPNVKVAFAA